MRTLKNKNKETKMKIYHVFAKLAAEGDYLHLTASLENNPPDHYHLISTQEAFSREDAILRFISLPKLNFHQFRRLLKSTTLDTSPIYSTSNKN
jgi:hypothetical protein